MKEDKLDVYNYTFAILVVEAINHEEHTNRPLEYCEIYN